MRAAYYDRKGPAHEVLQLGEVPTPTPGPGEVRVRVHASGINPSDTKMREGWGGRAAMPCPRIIPHNDGAGVIDAVGPGVTDRVGERVWLYEAQRDGRAFGTAAEFVVVPSILAAPLPDGIPFELGAGLGVPAMTAHRCLFADGPITGQTVLVAGGAGTVGRCAVQLARWGGAGRVIATAGSDAQMQVAREAGADRVLSYRDPDLARKIGEVDRVVEVAFGRNVMLDAAVLRTNGVIATYASSDNPAEQPIVPFLTLMMKDIAVRFTLVYVIPRAAKDQAIHDVNAALQAGALRPLIVRRLPLERIAEAHEAMGVGGLGGKLVLDL